MRVSLKCAAAVACVVGILACSSVQAQTGMAQTITIAPTGYITVGLGGTKQFTAYLGSGGSTMPDTNVTWSVGRPGVNTGPGNISPTGLYTAPAVLPSNTQIQITATSTTAPALSAITFLYLLASGPTITTVSPNPIPTGTVTLTIQGSGFLTNALVMVGGVQVGAKSLTSTSLMATVYQPAASSTTVYVVNPGTGPSNTLTVPVTTPTKTGGGSSGGSSGGGSGSGGSGNTTPAPVVAPAAVTLALNAVQQFNASNTTTWSSAFGSITAAGLYTAPAAMSASGIDTISAKGPGGTGTATVTLVPPPSITVNVVPGIAGTPPSGSVQFTATVNNSANQAVTWRVNGNAGGDPGNGWITAQGLYTAPNTVPTPNVVTVSALAAAGNGTIAGSATLTIQNLQAITWARFLDQATYGPTPALMAHVQQVGFEGLISEQFALPESPWPALSGTVYNAMDAFYGNAGNGQDQLRQRAIGALSEVIVEAINKNVNGDMIIPWLQILSKDALGNYRQLLKDITLDASMGHYLDLANSNVYGGAPNENYPREVMQLFSIGLVHLNQDGSVVLDPNNNNQPIPTYSQFDVQQMAKALAGWTYDDATHTVAAHGSYYAGPMVPAPGAHIIGPKTVLGQTIPGGQTAMQDVDSAIDILMNHPNTAPFVATRLIRALVTSNPSPAYIKAVADKFVDNGQGVKGDMQAVIHEVLMNAEARNDSPPPNFGRLRNPMQYFLSTARAMGWGTGGISGANYLMYGMNFGVLDPASVFGHYSPLYRIPQTGGLFGPEFQIYSASDAVNRAQFLYHELYVYPFNPALTPFINLAGNPQALIDSVDNALTHGRMSQNLRNAIANSLSAMPDDNQRAIEAIYLTAMSGEYLVQH